MMVKVCARLSVIAALLMAPFAASCKDEKPAPVTAPVAAPPTAPTIAPTIVPAATAVNFETADFSVTIPASLNAYDMATLDLGLVSKELGDSLDAGKVISLLRQGASNPILKLIVIHPEFVKGLFPANMNFVINPIAPGATLAKVSDTSVEQLKNMGCTELKRTEMQLGDIPCTRLEYEIKSAASAGRCYLMVHGGKEQAINISAPKGEASRVMFELAEQIVQTYKPR